MANTTAFETARYYVELQWLERFHDWRRADRWMADHYEVPAALCVGYLVVIFVLQRAMRARKPFDLSGPLFWWNFLLAAFSILGAIATVPYIALEVLHGAGASADPQAFMQRRRNSLAGEPGATRREPVSNSGSASNRYPETGRRLGEKRIYHVQVDTGEMLRGVELTYPVRWSDVLGESLFNTATFHQTYLLVVSFHMSFGRIDPRVRIPIFLIKRC